MGEKNKKSNGEQQQKEGAESNSKERGGSKGNVTIVLKVDLHCEGCVTKILKCIRSFDGVETANIGDGQITVVGKMDPAMLREKVEKKTRKRVELVSPKNNKNGDGKEKEKAKGRESDGGGGDVKKEEKKKEARDKNSNQKSDEKYSKPKENPITTVVLKVHLHCEGCIHKIRKVVVKTKGYRDVKIDKEKDTVTVTGALDMRALAEALKKHLKREVQIVPQKKEADKKDNSAGAKPKGGGEKGKNGGGGNGEEKGGSGAKMEGNKMQVQVGYPYGYPGPIVNEAGQYHYNYNPYAFGASHAPLIFSDENPNACTIM